ncbi:MAG TPA: hypothetical protein VFS93_03325 [Terrimesophilobacter sp.]|nr:hypothetical protein [Terrimesophilobacter sp.]
MIVVPLETWVSIGSLLIATLTLAAFTRSAVSSAEKRLGERIDSVEASLSKRIDSIETSLEKLDDRVYALAIGMRPLLESTEEKKAAVTRRPA